MGVDQTDSVLHAAVSSEADPENSSQNSHQPSPLPELHPATSASQERFSSTTQAGGGSHHHHQRDTLLQQQHRQAAVRTIAAENTTTSTASSVPPLSSSSSDNNAANTPRNGSSSARNSLKILSVTDLTDSPEVSKKRNTTINTVRIELMFILKV